MLKYYNINELWDVLINCIKHNKSFNNIKYEDSLETLQELLDNIKKEYEV